MALSINRGKQGLFQWGRGEESMGSGILACSFGPDKKIPDPILS